MIKEYGLLNKAKAMSLPSRYPHLNATKYESLYKYGSRLIQCSIDFDFILEGLHHEMMLRQQILHLQVQFLNQMNHTCVTFGTTQ